MKPSPLQMYHITNWRATNLVINKKFQWGLWNGNYSKIDNTKSPPWAADEQLLAATDVDFFFLFLTYKFDRLRKAICVFFFGPKIKKKEKKNTETEKLAS